MRPFYAVLAFDRLAIRVLETAGARHASLLFALGIATDGSKEILGVWSEADGWHGALAALRGRGLKGAGLAVGDLGDALGGALAQHLPQTTTYQSLAPLLARIQAAAGPKRRAAVKTAFLDALAAPGRDQAEARMRKLHPERFAPALAFWNAAQSALAPYFLLPAAARKLLATFDAGASLKAKLARRTARLPVFWRSEEQALVDTRALLKHVDEGWKIAPRLWAAMGHALLDDSSTKGQDEFVLSPTVTKASPVRLTGRASLDGHGFAAHPSLVSRAADA